MGSPLGPFLARASLPMREWGSEPDEEPDKQLIAEGYIVGLMLLGVYVIVSLEVAALLRRWLLVLIDWAS